MFRRRTHLTLFQLFIPLAVVAVVFSYVLPEGGSIYSFFMPKGMESECAMRRISGLSCGTCGMTGSFQSIVKGDLESALLRHSFGIPFFLFLIGMGVLAFLDMFNISKLPGLWFEFHKSKSMTIIGAIIAIFLSIFIIRIIGEIESGYLKPGGLEKLLFIWFYFINPSAGLGNQ